MTHTIHVRMTLTDAEMAHFTDKADLESTIAARLDEMYDRDGDIVQPKIDGITIHGDAEEPDIALARFWPMAGITVGDYLPSWRGFVVGTRRTAKRLYVTVRRPDGTELTDYQSLATNEFAVKSWEMGK